MKAESVSRNRPEIDTKSDEMIGLGSCIFDPVKREVRYQNGEIAPLRDQSLEVLSILAAHLNETVSKNTLVEAVWNDTFVTDDSLVQCISEIRKSIDDSDHKIIQTFAKKGYRLNAQTAAKTNAHAARRPVKAVLIGACVLVLGVIGISALMFQRGDIAKTGLTLPEQPSIAVLPFDNLSGDPKQGAFGEAIAEDIITALSRIPDMFVIARNSSFTYKGRAVKVQQVAEELGVRYVLEGSIQRSGNRVRISAQLIDALSGRHIWAERYDREVKDLFALQDDITRNVVTALEVKLTAGERARTQRRQTNIEAYELFLRARAVRRVGALSKSVNSDARELYRKVVALDPNFAPAWNGLAVTHWLDAHYGWTKNLGRSLSLAENAVGKALVIDDTLPGAYLHLANIAMVKQQYDQMIAHCEKALSLDPGAVVMVHCGRIWTYVGRSEEALELITKAMRRNPYFESIYFYALGNAHRMLGRYDKAISAMEAWRDMEPKVLFPLIMLAATYAEAGQMDRARATVKDSIKQFPNYTLKRTTRLIGYKDPKDIQRILDNLRKAGLPE